MLKLYAVFARRRGSRAYAEDLTQQTLERAFRAWARSDPGAASWSLGSALTARLRDPFAIAVRSGESRRAGRPRRDRPGGPAFAVRWALPALRRPGWLW